MSYKKGDLKVGREYDNRDDAESKVAVAYLPHSCDAWVVGSKDDAQALIADLQLYLDDKIEPEYDYMEGVEDDE